MRGTHLIKLCTKRGRGSERGIALFIAIFTLLLITAIATGMIMLTNTDLLTSSNFRDEQTAFFAAKAGMEEARDRLRSNAANSLSASLPTTTSQLPGMAGGVIYATNPSNGETDTPWLTAGSNYPDTEICTEITNLGRSCSTNATGWYTTASASSTYAASSVLAWKWTRITEKTNKTSSGTSNISTVDGSASDSNQLVCYGATEVTTTQSTCAAAGYKQVYVFTTLAVTLSGSRRMVQMEAAATGLPTVPGAMVLDGPNPTYGPPASAAFTVTGNDAAQGPNSGAGCPGAVSEPAVGGYDSSSVTTLNGDISGRSSSYTGSPASVSNVNSALGSLATVAGLNALVSSVTMAAAPGNVYTGNTSSITNWGTNAAPVINVVTGDLTTSGGLSGSGILLVEGTLTLSGNPSYNGLILVIGKGVVTKNGGGNGTLDGAMLVANLYNSSNQLITSGSPGTPTINWNGGGNATVQYDSCWANALNASLPYSSIGVREMMY
jgi:hypothetical protein